MRTLGDRVRKKSDAKKQDESAETTSSTTVGFVKEGELETPSFDEPVDL